MTEKHFSREIKLGARVVIGNYRFNKKSKAIMERAGLKPGSTGVIYSLFVRNTIADVLFGSNNVIDRPFIQRIHTVYLDVV